MGGAFVDESGQSGESRAEQIVAAFSTAVGALLQEMIQRQAEEIRQAGTLLARSLQRGGLIHTFGTGHSHLLAEEIYSRAGGLMPVNIIETAPLMMHEDAVASGMWERLSGAAEVMLDFAGIVPEQDVLIVISNSGRNAAPVEAAAWARSHSVPVIALTSLAHSRAEISLAPSGKKLYELADVVLNNFGVPGDAFFEITPGMRVAATSTIAGAFLLQSVVLSAIQQCIEHDFVPPTLRSGNSADARQANWRTLQRYSGRLPVPYNRMREQLRRRAAATEQPPAAE